MKLEQLRYFFEEIKRDLDPDIAFNIYYFFNDEWNLVGSSVELSPNDLNSLERARSESISYHSSSSRFAWFFIESLNAVVSIKFSTSPQLATRRTYRDRLTTILERAINSFKVSHNPLTLLLARDAFNSSLSEELKSKAIVNVSSIEAQESSTPPLLAVLAFDIDHFKQVNDTYGHIYGNQVLKTFAMRLEAVAIDIEKAASGSVRVVLGHPSGEEFLGYISGSCSREDVMAWAEQFRAKIADEILPSVSEWTALARAEDLSMLQLPIQQERGIRTSVGVAFQAAINSSDLGSDEANLLLDRADTALYRAKAAGRNQVVAFDAILEFCGRTLEHDRGTQVIAIDIGSNVGVALGQEFKVYSATFSGQKKFSISDGRTTRTLGTYPKVELTRITTFNVQPEISFAYISDHEHNDTVVENGSHLEAIPLGSIGHIVAHRSRYFTSGIDTGSKDDTESLKVYLENEVSKKQNVFAVVFRFVNDQEYLKKYGTAALNVALTQLYRDALNKIRPIGKIAALDSSSIAIVGKNDVYNADLIDNLLNEFHSDFPELGVVAGVFTNDDLIYGRKSALNLDPRNSAEFAQLAASQFGRQSELGITKFTFATAKRLLRTQLDSRAYTSGQADFEKLFKLGVNTPAIRNLGGLLYSAGGNFKQAAEQYEAAMIEAPELSVYKNNLGIVLKKMGENERALKIFNSIPKEAIPGLIKDYPNGSSVYAYLLALGRSNKSQNFDESRFELIAKDVLKYPDDFKAARKLEFDVISKNYVQRDE